MRQRLDALVFAAVGNEAFIALGCDDDVLGTLASDLRGFAPAEGAPEWLVSGAWLCTAGDAFLATASVEVLSDGYLARPLTIDRPAALAARIESELPDIQGRLMAKGNGRELPGPAVAAPPETRKPWPADAYEMSVLARVVRRETSVSRVACALLFEAEEGPQLLVGTDTSTLALVLSEDALLIDRYRQQCEPMSLDEYQARRGS